MGLTADLLLIMDLIFIPVDQFFILFFFWSPSLLRTFSASMLTLTLGSILSMSGKTSHKILKYIIYFFFLLYSIYMLGIINNMNNVSILDFTAIAFSIIAPMCMIIVGKRLASTKIKGFSLFNYYTMWGIYLLVALLYAFFYPMIIWDIRLIIMMFILLYVFSSLLLVYIFSQICGGS